MAVSPGGFELGSDPGRKRARTFSPFVRAAEMTSLPVFPDPPKTAIVAPESVMIPSDVGDGDLPAK